MINKLTNLNTIGELYEKGYDSIPSLPGIYTIIRPKSMKIKFSQDTTAIKEYNGKSMLFDVVDLKSKFIKSDMNILYI